MRIGIIGGGTVGRATARCYLEHCEEVRVFDTVRERATHPFELVLNTDLVFVCLPESAVELVLGGMEGSWKRQNFVLKSTVPIGTTRRLAEKYGFRNLVHSPEFLTERCAITDAQMPARNIVGTPNARIPLNTCGGKYANLLLKRFSSVPIHYMTSDESEAVKLMTNSFFAVKVAFFNEVRTLTDKLGLDWELVLAGVLSDGRIAHSHTKVPGPDGKRGFGGKCLPKDLEMLIECMNDAGVVHTMTTSAWSRNEHVDRREDQP